MNAAAAFRQFLEANYEDLDEDLVEAKMNQESTYVNNLEQCPGLFEEPAPIFLNPLQMEEEVTVFEGSCQNCREAISEDPYRCPWHHIVHRECFDSSGCVACQKLRRVVVFHCEVCNKILKLPLMETLRCQVGHFCHFRCFVRRAGCPRCAQV